MEQFNTGDRIIYTGNVVEGVISTLETAYLGTVIYGGGASGHVSVKFDLLPLETWFIWPIYLEKIYPKLLSVKEWKSKNKIVSI